MPTIVSQGLDSRDLSELDLMALPQAMFVSRLLKQAGVASILFVL